MNSAKNTPRLRKDKLTSSSSSVDSLDKEPVHVYCRLRPLKGNLESSCIKLLSPNVLVLTTPTESKTQLKEIHCRFKHIFTSYSKQKEVFDHLAYPLLEDLLKGKNSLLFTYGVTGSGKTYTLTGKENEPGIIPRCIHTLFNTIDQHQAPKFVIKPDKMNGFEIQSEHDAIQDRANEFRRKTHRSKAPRQNGNEKMNYYNDGTRISLINEMNLYSVFVSYVEIYNNVVYDLLDSNPERKKNKVIREDSNRNMYLNGVVEVEVKSAEEAFEVFNMGQMAKRMGHTQLNSESSRSHSIFNIRLAQFENYNNDGQHVIPESNVVVVSQLSLVDLAGSERTNRTNTTGARLREASSINNSLMTLRACMDALRENQLMKGSRVVPFRESKLTLMFRNYFEGHGSVQMIVCVNPSVDDFDENVQVMSFAENTQDVKIVRSEARTTPFVKRTIEKTPKIRQFAAFNIPPLPIFKLSVNNIEESLEHLVKLDKIFTVRKNKDQELATKFEKSSNELRRRLVEVNQENLVNKTELRSQKTLVNKSRQKMHNVEMKIIDLEGDNEQLLTKNRELEDKIIRLQNLLHQKDLKINQNILDKEKAKQKLQMKNEKISKELEDKLRKQREELNAYQEKETKMKEVVGYLYDEMSPIKRKTREGLENIAPPVPETPKQQLLIQKEPLLAATSTPRPNRRRRSRSVDNNVWLEHNAMKPLPLQTVMQPAMKKRKSISKLTKATDITNPKQSKYCLLAQEPDTDGELETKLYKADILPTTTGGAQVVFNDVEKLKQESPTR